MTIPKIFVSILALLVLVYIFSLMARRVYGNNTLIQNPLLNRKDKDEIRLILRDDTYVSTQPRKNPPPRYDMSKKNAQVATKNNDTAIVPDALKRYMVV